MKKLGGGVLMMAILTTALFSNIASADDGSDRKSNHDQWKMDSTQTKEDIMHNRMEIRDGRGNFHDEFGHLGDYLQTDLTDTEKGEVRDIIEADKKDIKDEVQTFIEVFTSSNSSDEEIDIFVGDLVVVKEQMYTDLDAYIDPSKQDEFDAYKEAILAQFKENFTLRLKNLIAHKGMEDNDGNRRKHALPDRFKAKIVELLGKKDDTTKGDFLQKILDKILNKMSQIESSDKIPEGSKQTLLDFLSDINGLVETEYNNLVIDSDDTSEVELADELSGDDDSNSSEDANDDHGGNDNNDSDDDGDNGDDNDEDGN